MTGYGQAVARIDSAHCPALGKVDLSVELRSVNGRFLDLSLRLPDELRSQESALRERLAPRIKRGKVECRVNLGTRAAGGDTIDSARLAQLLALQDELLKARPDSSALSVADILRWPGVVGGDWSALWSQPECARALAAAVDLAAQQALEQFLAARAREGARLVEFLLERCELIDRLADQAALLAPQAVERQQQRFLERFNEAWALATQPQGSIGGEGDAARERALAEAASYAMRIDVAEEIGRLKSHTTEIRQLLARGGELGKRLDFLVQELHREANTLGSKSSGMELTHTAIDLKVAIEQMREQVQNIE